MRPEAGAYVTREVRLEALIGEGGMGSVWLARDAYGRELAVKFISEELADDPLLRERFAREARAAQSIPSPHVVRTLAHGTTDDGTPYLVMELVRGESLRAKVLRTGALGLVEVASVVEQVAAALEAAHGAGIVHRDIKPENVFLVAPHGQVKVLDFGIAKREARDERVLTQVGMVMGTPEYMSPEQLLFPDRVEPGFDLWATAVVAYEALTGKLPFEGETPGEIVRSVVDRGYKAVKDHGLPPALDAFFAAAFSSDPAARPATARGLQRSFAACAAGALSLATTQAGPVQRPTLAIEFSAASGGVKTQIGRGTLGMEQATAPAAIRPAAGRPAGSAAQGGGAPRPVRPGTVPIPLVARAPQAIVQRAAAAVVQAGPNPAPNPAPARSRPPDPVAQERFGATTDRMLEGAADDGAHQPRGAELLQTADETPRMPSSVADPLAATLAQVPEVPARSRAPLARTADFEVVDLDAARPLPHDLSGVQAPAHGSPRALAPGHAQHGMPVVAPAVAPSVVPRSAQPLATTLPPKSSRGIVTLIVVFVVAVAVGAAIVLVVLQPWRN